MKQVGLEAVINDDVVSGVLGTGKWIGSLSVMALGGIIAFHHSLPLSLVAAMMVIGFGFGFAIMEMATVVVEISAATLFICFVKDPMALKRSHPDLHAKIIAAWEKKGGQLPGLEDAKAASGMSPGSSTASTGGGGGAAGVAAAGTVGAAAAMDESKSAADENSEIDLASVNKKFMEMLKAQPPPQLRKYPQSGNRGMSHMRSIIIDFDNGTLSWKPNDVQATIFLGDVTKVLKGAQTVYLKEKVKPEEHLRCFTIVTDKREINFEADSEETAKLWVKGLQSLIKSVQSAKGGAGKRPDSKCIIM